MRRGTPQAIGALLAGLLLPGFLSAQAKAESGSPFIEEFALPADSVSFHPGTGSDLATAYCLICHSADYVYTQPAHSKDTWTEIVHKMRRAFGCPLPENQVPGLVKYLVSQNDRLTEKIPSHPDSSSSSSSSGPRIGNLKAGQAVYNAYCLNCHGATGKGDGPIGTVLRPPAADLTAISGKSDDEILKTIRSGRPGTAMPSWSGDLTENEIQNVLAYIRSLGK